MKGNKGRQDARRQPRRNFAFPALLLLLFLIPQFAFADGGAVLAQDVAGPYKVTLFGSPSPLRAGPADLSVLIQDAKTGEPILDRPVSITVQAAPDPRSEAWLPPCCSMKTAAGSIAAGHAAAQNKLLYAANILLPASGSHDLTVKVGDQFLRTRVTVAPPAPPLSHYWAYLAAPPFLIAIFALNQRLRRRQSIA